MMSVLPGYENENLMSHIRYDDFQLKNLKRISWTEGAKKSLEYGFIRVEEVALKHCNLPHDYPFKNKDFRSVAQALFDIPATFSNRASEEVCNKYGYNIIANHFVGYDIKSRLDTFRKEYGKFITVDHEWPRAITAKKLVQQYIESPFTLESFQKMHEEKYGVVNLVSDNENGRLGQWIKKSENEFIDPKTTYQNNRIILINLEN